MNVALAVGLGWFAAGVLLVLGIETISRKSDSAGPLSQKTWPRRVGYAAALLVGAPLVILVFLGFAAQTILQGGIPFTDRAWSPTRAKHLEGPRSRESVLCDMHDLRRRRDRHLAKQARPKDWPVPQLWETTEGMILETAEFYLLLKADGLTERLIFEKLEAHRAMHGEGNAPLTHDLREYLRYRLSIEDPAYLSFGPDLFDRSFDLAMKGARDAVAALEQQEPFPPVEWLRRRLSVAEVEHHEEVIDGTRDGRTERWVFPFPKGREWEAMKVRMLKDDELWLFDSPVEHWQELMGRRGIALVRRGKPIVHIVTMMN